MVWVDAGSELTWVQITRTFCLLWCVLQLPLDKRSAERRSVGSKTPLRVSKNIFRQQRII